MGRCRCFQCLIDPGVLPLLLSDARHSANHSLRDLGLTSLPAPSWILLAASAEDYDSSPMTPFGSSSCSSPAHASHPAPASIGARSSYNRTHSALQHGSHAAATTAAAADGRLTPKPRRGSVADSEFSTLMADLAPAAATGHHLDARPSTGRGTVSAGQYWPSAPSSPAVGLSAGPGSVSRVLQGQRTLPSTYQHAGASTALTSLTEGGDVWGRTRDGEPLFMAINTSVPGSG